LAARLCYSKRVIRVDYPTTKGKAMNKTHMNIDVRVNVPMESVKKIMERTGMTEEQVLAELEHRFTILIGEHKFVDLEPHSGFAPNFNMYPITEGEVTEDWDTAIQIQED